MKKVLLFVLLVSSLLITYSAAVEEAYVKPIFPEGIIADQQA